MPSSHHAPASAALASFAAKRTEETGVTVTRAPLTISVGVAAGFIRMLLLVAVPIVIALTALLTQTNIGGGKWVTALIALLAVSALATLGWLGFRWMRMKRNRRGLEAATHPTAG